MMDKNRFFMHFLMFVKYPDYSAPSSYKGKQISIWQPWPGALVNRKDAFRFSALVFILVMPMPPLFVEVSNPFPLSQIFSISEPSWRMISTLATRAPEYLMMLFRLSWTI